MKSWLIVPIGIVLAFPGLAQENGTDGETNPNEYLLTYEWDWDPWAKDAPLAERQVLVYNNGAEPETLDPAMMTGIPEHRLAMTMFEGLTTLDPKTLQARPGMAETWEISPDGLVYTFHLRKDAVWVNRTGEVIDPVTSRDFWWAWKRVLDPATGSLYAEQLFYVKNAAEFNKKEIDDFAKVGVEMPDDHTLVVTLRAPTPFFMELTAFETLMPVHRATVERHGLAWTKPENIATNGPFRLKDWLPRERITFVKNEKYWEAGKIVLQQIDALPIEDDGVAYNKFLKEEVDWILAIPTPRVDEVRQNFDYYVVPYLGSYFFRFNVKKAPFDNSLVRKAFAMSVDRVELCRNVLKAGQVPATGHVPSSIEKYMPYEGVEGLGFDPVEARELLAEAGYPEGKDFPKVELLYNTNEGHKLVSQFLVETWRNNLGVNVELYNCEWKVYLDLVHNENYQISRAGWIGDYVDPNTFLDMFVTGRGNNNTGWSNAKYDELIDMANRELDREKRMKFFQDAERILCLEDLPILPIYFYVNQGCLSPAVRGVWHNIRDMHPPQYVWIAEE